MKEYLNNEEISRIIKESNNPIYKDPRIISIGRSKTDIIRVSKIHELIFFNGNDYTGFKHINQRHLQYQEIPKWIKKRDKAGQCSYVLDKPSYFHSSIVPIWDYPKIADAIYRSDNLDITNNKTPQYIDLYMGIYNPEKYPPAPYRLLLYKGTKIVHNIYPITDKFSPIRILNFKKGSPRGTLEVKSLKSTIEVPYYDHNHKVRYKIVFKREQIRKKEKIFIYRFSEDGIISQRFFVAERELLFDVTDQKSMWFYEFSEYPKLESIILSIDNSIKNGAL